MEHQGVHKNSFRNVRAFQDRCDASIESYNERPAIQQLVQSSAIVSNFVAPAKASQANALLRVTAQSRSPLRVLQQNQSTDEIRSINQQSNVSAQQTNAAQNFSSCTFKTVHSIFMGSLRKMTSEK